MYVIYGVVGGFLFVMLLARFAGWAGAPEHEARAACVGAFIGRIVLGPRWKELLDSMYE